MKRYKTVGDSSESSSRIKDTVNSDSLSLVSISSRSTNRRRFNKTKRINSELSEPLTIPASTVLDDESSSVDPYFVFRSDLENKIELADEFLVDFLRIIQETQSSSQPRGDLLIAKKKIKRHLKSCDATLRDVRVTVQAVENDRNKFPYIDDSQLNERKFLVETSQRSIQHVKDEMNSNAVKRNFFNDELNKAVRCSSDGLLGAKNDEERRNTNFILDSQAQSSILIQDQDETLDELGEAVARVGEMAGNIGEEIGKQNKMLDDLDEDMINAEEELGLVLGKLAKFIGTKNRWQLRTIVILTLIVIVMIFLVIYS